MQPYRELASPLENGTPPPRPLLRDVTSAPPKVVAGPQCTCGHGRQAHEHYRRGHDCAMCSCAKFSRPLLVRLGLRGG
jgi:hypothetical protein